MGQTILVTENDFRKGPAPHKPASLIARRIEKRRLECGLSRRELADICKSPFNTFNHRLLHGDVLAKWLVPLARELHCPVDWLLTGRVPGRKKSGPKKKPR